LRYSARLRIEKRGIEMARRSYRPEEIINKLREAEVLFSQGSTVGEAARKIGVTEQTYYRWRRKYRWHRTWGHGKITGTCKPFL